MNIEVLKQILHSYNDIIETNKHWDSRPMTYENEYIKVVSLDDSNKHNSEDYNKYDKMWSIVYSMKQTFINLENFKLFQKEFNAYISSVNKGKSKGCFAIRIPDMKECPNTEIAKVILDFIFSK